MLGILRGLNTKPFAIDQPIDFDIPESIVMLAVYHSIPEAENNRRGRNASDGMRRARKMGRWPGRAPMGYINLSTQEGRKIMKQKQPQADLIKWAFEQFAKGTYSINQVRIMTIQKGLQCSKNNFWKILHNPIYCGIITVKATKDEDIQYVKGIHKPIIFESLYRKVQFLLKSKRKQRESKLHTKYLFPLRGFINCPFCRQKLTGSTSQGKLKKYSYYHCNTSKCKGRFRADFLEKSYESLLQKITILPNIYELFNLILEDENIFTARRQALNEKYELLLEVSHNKELLAKAKRYLLAGKIDFEDFREMKKEHNEINYNLNERLQNLTQKLNLDFFRKEEIWTKDCINIFQVYNIQDFVGKRHITNMFTPSQINISTKEFETIQINPIIKKITMYDGLINTKTEKVSKIIAKNINQSTKYFSGWLVSTSQAMKILRKNGIKINEDEGIVILDFLYMLASYFKKDPNFDLRE